MVQLYISAGVRQILYSATRRPKNSMKIKHLISPVQYHGSVHCSCHALWWNLISVETDEPFQHLNFHDRWWKIMIIEGTWLWRSLFPRLCHLIDRYVLQSLKLQKMLFVIPVLCQSVDTWRCDVHHYWLWEARCLVNYIFDIQRSLHCFSYIQITLFSYPLKHLPTLLLPSNFSHNIATATWGAFFLHLSGLQTSINSSAAVPFTSLSSTKSCPVSTLIGRWRLFALSTVSCVFSLKGERSQSLDRDQPPHQSWPKIACLSLPVLSLSASSLSHWLFFCFSYG